MTKTLRKHVAQRLANLQYDFTQFTLNDFKNWVEQKLHKSIHMVAWENMPLGIYGVWMTWLGDEQTTEVIFYDGRLPTVHRIHTLLHELAHIICGHKTLQLDQEKHAYLKEHPERLDDLLLQTARFRAIKNSDEHEVEAETLALLAHEQAIKHGRLTQLTVMGEDDIASYIQAMGLN